MRTIESCFLLLYSYPTKIDRIGARNACSHAHREIPVGIPKAFREVLGFKAGQQFVFVAQWDAIAMTPQHNIGEVRGLLKGAENVCDRVE
ncbi:MAG: hypothetical protein K2P57_10575 [Burkholderiales bacterium]|nr:hypothetical protein [Burkholderiales bacterium]